MAGLAWKGWFCGTNEARTPARSSPAEPSFSLGFVTAPAPASQECGCPVLWPVNYQGYPAFLLLEKESFGVENAVCYLYLPFSLSLER